MKYKCCEHLLGSIDLGPEGFKYCNEVWEGPEYVSYTDENAFKKNEERRLKIIENLKKDIVPQKCKLCPLLEDKDWKEFDGKIHRITVFNWKHCNAACFYCSVNSTFSEEIQKSEHYDSLPIIKELINNERITPESFIAFMGGEPTILKEFPKIAKLLLDKNCQLEVLTNGIIYEPIINEILKAENNNRVCISLDCGSKETYKKIKRVDKYLEVTENIKKYILEAGDKADRIKVKYIILPRVNDNKKEIDLWLDFCKSANVKTISRAVNHSDSKMNSKNKLIEISVIKAYNYIEKRSKKLGIEVVSEPWADAIVQNKVYNCRKVSILDKIISGFRFIFGTK